MLAGYPSFFDELVKISTLLRLERAKAKRRVDHFFSPRAGKEKWDRLQKNVSSKTFVDQLAGKTKDEKLIRHVKSMHDLIKSPVLSKVESKHGKGLRYEIRKLPDGRLGCTCPDWRYVGSVTPGYECKHIRAFKAGRVQA